MCRNRCRSRCSGRRKSMLRSMCKNRLNIRCRRRCNGIVCAGVGVRTALNCNAGGKKQLKTSTKVTKPPQDTPRYYGTREKGK